MSYPNEAYAEQALKQSYTGGLAGQAVPVETATSVLSETMQKADKLVTRILQLSNRLCGAEPPEPTSTSQDAVKLTDGLLLNMKDSGWAMQRRIHAAENALDRIEALL